MPHEVVNNLRSTSIIRAVDPGTYTITLNNLSSNTQLETVSAVNIKRVVWSTNGSITIGRGDGPTPMLALHNAGQMYFDELGYSIANTNTGNVVVTIATGGSIAIEVSKIATYSTALENI
jgi:hypothetical protein